MNQRGFSNVLIPLVVIVLITIGGGYYFYSQKPTSPPTNIFPAPVTPIPTSTNTDQAVLPVEMPYEIVSTDSLSGNYIVTQELIPDNYVIKVDHFEGLEITDNLLEKNNQKLGYGVKFGCQCSTRFIGWTKPQGEEEIFVIQTNNGNGESYQHLVQASDATVIESSLRRVK